eukprot:3293732-Pleurochrysis_carterae.AAC.1
MLLRCSTFCACGRRTMKCTQLGATSGLQTYADDESYRAARALRLLRAGMTFARAKQSLGVPSSILVLALARTSTSCRSRSFSTATRGAIGLR